MVAYVKNHYGDDIDFEAAMAIADDDIREELHNKMAPCEDQEFFDAYAEEHKAKYGEDFAPYVGAAW